MAYSHIMVECVTTCRENVKHPSARHSTSRRTLVDSSARFLRVAGSGGQIAKQFANSEQVFITVSISPSTVRIPVPAFSTLSAFRSSLSLHGCHAYLSRTVIYLRRSSYTCSVARAGMKPETPSGLVMRYKSPTFPIV